MTILSCKIQAQLRAREEGVVHTTAEGTLSEWNKYGRLVKHRSYIIGFIDINFYG